MTMAALDRPLISLSSGGVDNDTGRLNGQRGLTRQEDIAERRATRLWPFTSGHSVETPDQIYRLDTRGLAIQSFMVKSKRRDNLPRSRCTQPNASK